MQVVCCGRALQIVYKQDTCQQVALSKLFEAKSRGNLLQLTGEANPEQDAVGNPHPLVLLSVEDVVEDHFNRTGEMGDQKRIVGVLLGR